MSSLNGNPGKMGRRRLGYGTWAVSRTEFVSFLLVNDFFHEIGVPALSDKLRLKSYSCFGSPAGCKSAPTSGSEFGTQCKIDERIARSD